MTPLERLHSDLANARLGAEREGSDRHSNPGRAARDLRRQAESRSDVHRLEQAIAIASNLDARGINWTSDAKGRLSFLFQDGSSYPVDVKDDLDGQMQLVKSALTAHDARRALTVRALDPHAPRDLKWLRDRLAGSSTPKFRSVFLTQAGLLENGVLTELGHTAGFFIQHEGEYGPYQTVTAAGVAWIYAAYLIAGEIVTHQLIVGRGTDLSGVFVAPVPDGELGALAIHALRLFTDALEAQTETSRFVQLMSLIEFLADPNGFTKMQDARKAIGRQIARDRADYDAIQLDFHYLATEPGPVDQPKRGLRHNIVHLGRRLEDLTTAAERKDLFRRLTRYVGVPISRMIEHGNKDWSFIEAMREEARVRLKLT